MNRGLFNLFKASTIVGAIFGGLGLAYSVVYLFSGFSAHIHEMLADAYNNGYLSYPLISDLDGESFATLVQGTLIGIGFFLIVFGIISVIASILSIRVRNNPTRALFIALIIFGFMSFDVPAVGGIIGLIVLKKQQPQQ